MNNRRIYNRVLAPLALSIASLFSANAIQAADIFIDTTVIDDALEIIQRQHQATAESQEIISELTNQTSTLFAEFKVENNNLEVMTVRNANWRRLINSQEQDIATLDESIASVEVVTREIPFLMEKMLSALEQFIELDLPFHVSTRRNQLALARAAMDDPDVAISEKFRSVLNLYQIENVYGRTRETYPETIVIEGVERDVDILRVGRIALMYQTTDTLLTGVWDQTLKDWVTLDPGEYRVSIQKAIKVASGLVAPEIINLPIAAPR